MNKVICLSAVFVFLTAMANDAAAADRIVTVRAGSGSERPQVFIVTQNPEGGPEIRTLIPANPGKATIPEGTKARVEIAGGDPTVTVKGEGDLPVIVSGGTPDLRLTGDTQVVVSDSDKVGKMQVTSDAGNQTIIVGGKAIVLPKGIKIMVTNGKNRRNIIRIVQAEGRSVPAEAGEKGQQAILPGVRKVSFELTPEEVELLKSLSILHQELTPAPTDRSQGSPPASLLFLEEAEDPYTSVEEILPEAAKTATSDVKTPKKPAEPGVENPLERFQQDIRRKLLEAKKKDKSPKS